MHRKAAMTQLSRRINRGPIEANDQVPSRAGYLQSGDALSGSDDGADSGGQVTEAKGGEKASDSGGETTSKGLDTDKQSRGAISAQNTEKLVGGEAKLGGLGGEVGNTGDGSNNGTDGTLDSGEVESVGEGGLSIDEDRLVVQAGDGQNVVELRALQVGDDTLEGGDDSADNFADGREAKASQETLDSVVELNKDVFASAGDEGEASQAGSEALQLRQGASGLDDLANGAGSTAEVKASELVSEALLKLNQHVLAGLLVGDGQDTVDGLADGANSAAGGGTRDDAGRGRQSHGNGGQEGRESKGGLHFDGRE
jgi:hypothetical protein